MIGDASLTLHQGHHPDGRVTWCPKKYQIYTRFLMHLTHFWCFSDHCSIKLLMLTHKHTRTQTFMVWSETLAHKGSCCLSRFNSSRGNQGFDRGLVTQLFLQRAHTRNQLLIISDSDFRRAQQCGFNLCVVCRSFLFSSQEPAKGTPFWPWSMLVWLRACPGLG